MGPEAFFKGILGTLKGTYKVESKYTLNPKPSCNLEPGAYSATVPWSFAATLRITKAMIR